MCVVCASLEGYNSPQWITGYLCVWYVRQWGIQQSTVDYWILVCVVCASLGGTIVHSGLLDTCVCGMCVNGGYNSPQWITGYLCVWCVRHWRDTIVHSGLLDTCVCGMCVTGGIQ